MIYKRCYLDLTLLWKCFLNEYGVTATVGKLLSSVKGVPPVMIDRLRFMRFCCYNPEKMESLFLSDMEEPGVCRFEAVHDSRMFDCPVLLPYSLALDKEGKFMLDGRECRCIGLGKDSEGLVRMDTGDGQELLLDINAVPLDFIEKGWEYAAAADTPKKKPGIYVATGFMATNPENDASCYVTVEKGWECPAWMDGMYIISLEKYLKFRTWLKGSCYEIII